MTVDQALAKYIAKLQKIRQIQLDYEKNIEEAFNLFQDECKHIKMEEFEKNHGSKAVDFEP